MGQQAESDPGSDRRVGDTGPDPLQDWHAQASGGVVQARAGQLAVDHELPRGQLQVEAAGAEPGLRPAQSCQAVIAGRAVRHELGQEQLYLRDVENLSRTGEVGVQPGAGGGPPLLVYRVGLQVPRRPIAVGAALR